jgi:hypothetical protein
MYSIRKYTFILVFSLVMNFPSTILDINTTAKPFSNHQKVFLGQPKISSVYHKQPFPVVEQKNMKNIDAYSIDDMPIK